MGQKSSKTDRHKCLEYTYERLNNAVKSPDNKQSETTMSNDTVKSLDNDCKLTREYFMLLNYDRTMLKLQANASLYKNINPKFKTYETLLEIINCPGFDIENISGYISDIGLSILNKPITFLSETEMISAKQYAILGANILKKSIDHDHTNIKYFNIYINCTGYYFIGNGMADYGYVIDKDIVNEVYLNVIKKDGLMLQYINNLVKTYDLCLEAYKKNILALEYFPNCLKNYPDELIKEAGL